MGVGGGESRFGKIAQVHGIMKVKNKKGSGAFGVHQQSTNSRYG